MSFTGVQAAFDNAAHLKQAVLRFEWEDDRKENDNAEKDSARRSHLSFGIQEV